ncbi:MAG: HEAT repeat domain-containing protein [Phycisphaerales bacterium]|nr:HEAT repeat domain-containing protein [Phycisphaerales bacterium]
MNTWRLGRAVAGALICCGLGSTALGHRHEDEHENGCLAGKLERLERSATIEAGAFDETTGRDLRNYPPDRLVDFRHMKLQLRFESLDDQRFTAIESLSVVPIGSDLGALKLNAVDLKINSVKLAGKDVEFSHDDKYLSLRFEPALAPGDEHELIIDYICDQPIDGMTFTPSSPDAPDYSAQVHTQGETEFNRHWFVCHDFPNERMTTELIVDVPAEFSVSSNGKLVSSLVSGDRAVWHYLQDKPHVSYLVSLIVGKFDIVEIPHSRVPMKVWAPEGLGSQVAQTYGRTGEMIDLFEKRFGVAYAWDRYDQLCAKNFHAGGMENTSATTMYPTAILDKTALLDGDLDGLIAHELCHQWTGDLITCKSWEHIWLNEGWATYGSAMWNEQRYGQEGYLDSIRGNFNVAERDRTTNDTAMVSPVYGQAGETFRRVANPYSKGSAILHMLRMMLGDEVFWKGVQLYMNRHATGVAETSDFRYAMEEVSGRGLEWFFDQWCQRPGTPELAVKVRYFGAERELIIDVEQKQKIDANTPAFRFTLPLVARTQSGDHEFKIDVAEKTAAFRTTLDGPPSLVAIDPYLHVLKTMKVEKPQAMWIEQAKHGPTIAARHEAVEALGETDSPESIALLTQLITDEKVRYTLRNTAVSALAGYGSPEAKAALLAIIKAGVSEAKVRANLVERLRNREDDGVIDMLADFATNDPSYATRVAAIEGLAQRKANDKIDLIVELVEFKSQHDQVRNAALRALADLDEPRGLDLGVKYAAYGYTDRSRPRAIDTVGRLAKHDKEKAVAFLLKLLDDPESRAVNAAGDALATVGDERAIVPIRTLSTKHRDPAMRDRASAWLKKLQEGNPGAASQPDDGGRRRRRG